MRRWILTLGLVASAPAFSQTEGEASPAAPAEPAAAPAAPAAAPSQAPAPAEKEPARASAPAEEPAAAPAPVKPAAAKVRTKPAAAAAPAGGTGTSASQTEIDPAQIAPPGGLSAPPPNLKAGAGTAPRAPLSPEQQQKYQQDVQNMLDQMQQRADATPEAAVQAPLTPKQLVEINARAFFFSLMSGDARSIATQAALPFTIEDRRLTHPDEVFDVWLKHLRSKRTDLLVLYGIEVLTPQEMEAKYGKPPARLASFPWKQGTTYIAIGNLSGRPAIALFRETRPSEFYLVGYTD